MNFGAKQEFESKLYTGFFLGETIAVNPTREQLAKLKGYELKEPEEGKEIKEFSYEGKTPEGDEYVDMVFYIKAITHPDKPIFQHRFRLVDKDVISEKEENGVKTVKCQWVNQQGFTAWCDDKKNLLDKFTKIQKKTYEDKVLISTENLGDSEYRLAIQGEGALYNFIQAWCDKGSAFTGKSCLETNVFIDKKKAFRNIEKYVESEIRPEIGNARTGPFNILAMVGISEKDGKVNHFQNVYNEFWPDGKYTGWKFKSMLPCITSGNWNLNENTIKTHDYLVKSLKKSAFTLGWLSIFDEKSHMNAGNETFKAAEGGSDATDVDDTTY